MKCNYIKSSRTPDKTDLGVLKMKRPDVDLSWYVKWIAASGLLASLAVRSMGDEGDYYVLDNTFNFIGVFGWLVVGLLWKDKSIIISQAVGTAMLLYVLYQATKVIG
mgnify:FL=1